MNARGQVEAISAFKMNVLHLHLTDDQGWRINVPGFPALLRSAWREGGSGQHPVCVCVFVCLCVSERERESVCE